MAGVTGNNQPKAAEEEMVAEMAMAKSDKDNNGKDKDGGDGDSGDGGIPARQTTIS